MVTERRRRIWGMVRTRGGTRIPVICMVANRKFMAALSTGLRVIIPEV